MSKCESKSNTRNSIISGLISGTITAATLQPFEYVKTRLQQPNEQIKPTIRSVIRATLYSDGRVSILGVSKLWSGLTPSLMRSAPVAALFFASFDYLKHNALLHQLIGQYQIVHSFLIGTMARVLADTLLHPLGLVKTRFESSRYNYTGVWNALSTIAHREGLLGLYKGLGATLARDISYSGLYLAIYTKTKQLVSESSLVGKRQDTTAIFFASCALTSSVLACGFTQPPDVIRSYMQLSPQKYHSVWYTAKYIYAESGWRGFFAGFLPRSSRRISISVLSWTIYEKLTIK